MLRPVPRCVGLVAVVALAAATAGESRAQGPEPIVTELIDAAQEAVPGTDLSAPPPPLVPDVEQRSGLLMRSTAIPGSLPPDKYRDNFYATRYADRGLVRHLRINPKSQGLYGLGWKATNTESVYPFFYGNPGRSSVTEATRPWHPSLRVFQGMAHPFKPVGMYYAGGSYVPIYDIDPVVPGPGPYPFPFYFNWNKGG